MRYITTTKYSLFATSRTQPCIVLNYCLKIPNFYAVESGSKMALFQKHAKKPIFCSLLFSYSYFKSFCVNYRLYFISNIISHYITFNIFKMKFNRKNISVPVYMRWRISFRWDVSLEWDTFHSEFTLEKCPTWPRFFSSQLAYMPIFVTFIHQIFRFLLFPLRINNKLLQGFIL